MYPVHLYLYLKVVEYKSCRGSLWVQLPPEGIERAVDTRKWVKKVKIEGFIINAAFSLRAITHDGVAGIILYLTC